MTKLTEERIKELATAQRGPRGELIWPDFPINFARAIEAVLQPVQEPVAWMAAAYRKFINKETDHLPIGVQVSLVDMGWPNQIPLYTAPPDQTAEIERLRKTIMFLRSERPLARKLSNYEERIATLEAALREAKEMVESWGAYASPYFQERHDLVGDIAILSKALGEE